MSLYIVQTQAGASSKGTGRQRRRRYLVDRNGAAAARYAVQSHLHERRQELGRESDDFEARAWVTSVSLAVNSPAYLRALSGGKKFQATRLP